MSKQTKKHSPQKANAGRKVSAHQKYPKPIVVAPASNSPAQVLSHEVGQKPEAELAKPVEKKEQKAVKYIWPASLQGRRFVIRVVIVTIILIAVAGLAQILLGSFAAAAVLAIFGAIISLII